MGSNKFGQDKLQAWQGCISLSNTFKGMLMPPAKNCLQRQCVSNLMSVTKVFQLHYDPSTLSAPLKRVQPHVTCS